MELVEKAGARIKDYVRQSKSIDIAVALASDTAVDILKKAKKNCKIRFIAGINLPTPCKVLKQLKNSYKNNARIYISEIHSETFHPKVYIFNLSNGSKKVLLGSGNFTDGGLYNNIEASVLIEDKDMIVKVEKWFDEIFNNSKPISDEFLKKYEVYADAEIKHDANKKRNFMQLLSSLGSKTSTEDVAKELRKNVIKELRCRMKMKKYQEDMNRRSIAVKDIYDSIDIKHNFKNFNIEKFYKIKELGHIIPIYKSHLQAAKQNGKLTKVLKMLIDENTPLSERFDSVMELKKKYGIKGIGDNVLSKVLCVYDPKKYVVLNTPAKIFFQKELGLKPPKGLTDGEKYQFYCNIFRDICQEAGVPDMAILDVLIW